LSQIKIKIPGTGVIHQNIFKKLLKAIFIPFCGKIKKNYQKVHFSTEIS
jgi:hypothetical protein